MAPCPSDRASAAVCTSISTPPATSAEPPRISALRCHRSVSERAFLGPGRHSWVAVSELWVPVENGVVVAFSCKRVADGYPAYPLVDGAPEFPLCVRGVPASP